jgi:hypothetical protein
MTTIGIFMSLKMGLIGGDTVDVSQWLYGGRLEVLAQIVVIQIEIGYFVIVVGLTNFGFDHNINNSIHISTLLLFS